MSNQIETGKILVIYRYYATETLPGEFKKSKKNCFFAFYQISVVWD